MKKSGDNAVIGTCNRLIRSVFLSRWYLPTVMVVGFAVRFCWILVFHSNPVSDFAFYFRSAACIVRGYGYITDHGFATAYFPIGYPFFLAMLFRAFGITATIAQTANLVLSLVSLWLAYLIARDIFRSEIAGRLSLLLLALYPNNIAYTSLLATEILHLFLLLLGVWLLLPLIQRKEAVRTWRLLIVGLVFGFATLVKVQTLMLPAALLILFPRSSWKMGSLFDRLKGIVIVYFAMVLSLSPWVIRNYRLFSDIVLTNNGGLNLYIGNGPEADGTYVEIPWLGVVNSTSDEYRVNKTAGQEAIDYAKAHPWRTLALMPRKLVALFDNGDGMYWNHISAGNEPESAGHFLSLLDQVNPIYESVTYVLFAASLLFGCWKRLRLGKGNGWPLLGIVVVFYFIGIYLVYYGAARYNFPIIPWMMMYAAALLSSVFEKMRPEDTST
jgi:hypothetical protein